MPAAAVGIAYLDGPRLQRSLLAAAEWVEAGRDELNRINVFPVPDGDTGTNVALTLRAVANAVRPLPRPLLPLVAQTMAEAGILGARGNSGMLLSQFLLGFREALAERTAATPAEVAGALRAGSARLEAALDQPVEGTILTVCREAAEAAERRACTAGGLSDLMRETLERSEAALRRTPELLPALKRAGVVDAGAKAFVRLIEGIVRLIDGHPTAGAAPSGSWVPDAAAAASVAPERDYRFCTEALVRGGSLPELAVVRSRLRELGGSIVLSPAATLLKIHIHTDEPERVFSLARGWGTLEASKAEDMREQHDRLQAPARRLAIVVDSSCDLPHEIIERHGITVVPIQVMDGDRSYLDRVDITAAEIYRRMRDERAVFTTSQPAPGAFATAFRSALDRTATDEVVAVLLSSTLSGTFASACAVARAEEFRRVTVMDSRTITLGLGLQALRAAELAAAGRTAAEIARHLEALRASSGGFFTVERLEYLLRSGRVGRARAWLGDLLDLKPILEVSAEGVYPLDRVRGSAAHIPRVLEHLDGRLAGRRGTIRLGIVHADAPDRAEELRERLVARYRPEICLVGEATAAIGAHAGPGAWGVFYQIDAGGNSPAPD